MSTKPTLRRREFWLLLGACVLVLLLVPVVRHYQLRAAARAYVAQLRAQGEKLDLAEVIPPAVPPEQDSSVLLLQATALLDADHNFLSTNPPSAMHMVTPGQARIGWQQPAVVDGKASNSWTEVEQALEQDSVALALLRQIPSHPTFDFNLPYEKGIHDIPTAYLTSAKRAAQHLSAAALTELRRDDTEAATKDIRAMLALANGLRHDRLLISELVRMVIDAMACDVIWELLQSPHVTDAQLATLQADWAGLEFALGAEHVLLLERAQAQITISECRNSAAALKSNFGIGYALDWDDLSSAKSLGEVLLALKMPLDVFRWR